ncbi:MAG: hypothetical protein R6U85_09460, partial [Salinivirgaceae bacterium]
MGKKAVQTPLMRQYYQVKDKYPDAILLFRVGDFYETFENDAIKASEILGITLTKRANRRSVRHLVEHDHLPDYHVSFDDESDMVTF